MHKIKNQEIGLTKSCGNVFKDLERKNCETLILKSLLMSKINDILVTLKINTLSKQKKELSQLQLAEILNCPQTYVSALLKGKINHFSIERLINFLDKLGHEVKITINKKRVKQ